MFFCRHMTERQSGPIAAKVAAGSELQADLWYAVAR